MYCSLDKYMEDALKQAEIRRDAILSEAEGVKNNDGRRFRVIIAGAGVAGLAMSHALQKVNIDHVVLEKGVVAPDWGASISLWGHGSRILNQLGCLDALEAAALPLQVLHTRDQDGKAFSQEAFFTMMKERNGFEAITMERRAFLRIVYDQLPDKSYIKTGKRVVDVVDNEDGVTVKLDDGTVEEGDMLIGCDGVHSTVRELMWREANTAIPDYISTEEKQSLVATYKSLVGVAWTPPGLGIRDMHWVSHRGLSFLILTQPDKTYFFVNWKMAQPMKWPAKAKWSQAEADAAAATVAGLPISDSVVFGELWKRRIRGNLIGLEEGIFKHWSFGRIALVGDSVHKVTPNFALGAQIGLESAVVLLNQIYAMNKGLTPGERPNKAAVSDMLQRYQQVREQRTKEAYDASYFITRLQAYDGLLNHFIMRQVFPRQGQAAYADKLADFCSGAPKLDFLPVNYPLPNSFKWKDGETQTKKKEERSSILQTATMTMKSIQKTSMVEMLSLTVLVMLVYILFGGRTDKAALSPHAAHWNNTLADPAAFGLPVEPLLLAGRG